MLASWPTEALFALFAAAALVVWQAGRRLPAIAAAIAGRTGLGQAFAGMLLLGGITSLPELATATSAAALGAPALALNNALGSAAFNILLLALADAALGRSALTAVIARSTTLLQGVLGMLLLAGAAAVLVVGDVAIPLVGAGAGAALLFGGCLAAMRIAAQYESRPTWVIAGEPPPPPEQPGEADAADGLFARFALLAALILAAGVALSQSADAIAERTGLGEGLVGLVLLAAATSLPEASVITAAVRAGRCELAVGDIFGANLFNVAMIFVIDLAAPGPPVLAAAGAFEAFAALMALLLTGIFVIGLIERRDRTALRMGYDSLAALAVYAAGVALLTRLAAQA